LERRSTITMMIDLFPNLGKMKMNSIEISIPIAGGIGILWSVPRVFTIYPLLH
jgi:hypothetical protein